MASPGMRGLGLVMKPWALASASMEAEARMLEPVFFILVGVWLFERLVVSVCCCFVFR